MGEWENGRGGERDTYEQKEREPKPKPKPSSTQNSELIPCTLQCEQAILNLFIIAFFLVSSYIHHTPYAPSLHKDPSTGRHFSGF
jgi:hypothetical protein